MKDIFVTYNIALTLKKLGFNLPCLAKFCKYNPQDNFELFPESQDFFKGYFNTCSNEEYIDSDKVAAPTWDQAIEWLKSKNVLVAPRWDGWEYGAYEWDDFIYCDTKEEGIIKGLEILKQG